MKVEDPEGESEPERHPWLPFVAGLLAGAAGAVLVRALRPRPGLDPRLLRHEPHPDIPPTVVVPGILGSQLVRPDGTLAWLNLGNAVGAHDLALPPRLPLEESRDDLTPAGLLGVDAALPRLFGFTEYADLLELLDDAGFRRGLSGPQPGYHVFTYDWRRDLVESARRLGTVLDALAEESGRHDARFNLVGHSMGGLVARYYLRYGDAEPGGAVTWAGARRVAHLVLVATPSGGSIPALEALLTGNRVGFSNTTLSAAVVAHMPALYELLPPSGTRPLLDENHQPIDLDLHDLATWERFGWGPWATGTRGRAAAAPEQAFLEAVLTRARAFHAALALAPQDLCPVRVTVLGGDCLATTARAVVPKRRGAPPRFEPWTREESRAMLEAGDGRVTRASVLASHLGDAHSEEPGCGVPEFSRSVFGHADHHGIYSEPTFQSLLLRVLLRPVRPLASVVAEPAPTP